VDFSRATRIARQRQRQDLKNQNAAGAQPEQQERDQNVQEDGFWGGFAARHGGKRRARR
jgi:hypothetical protein